MNPLDFKDFKKVNSTSKYTVFQHPEGHMIHLNHGNLQKQDVSDIRKLPFEKFNKGGKVEKPKKEPKIDEKKAAEVEKSFKDALGYADGGKAPAGYQEGGRVGPGAGYPQINLPSLSDVYSRGTEAPPPPAGSPFGVLEQMTEQPPRAPPLTPPTPSPAIPGQPQPGVDVPQMDLNLAQLGLPDLSGQEQALQQQVDIIGQQGAAQAESAERTQQTLQSLERDSKSILDSMEQETRELFEATKSRQIDPDRYLGSKGTWGKIGTMLGLMLGGAGAAETGGRNLVAEMLDKEIDRDIRAQEANLNKDNNLLKFNIQRFDTRQEAIQATRAQIMELQKLEISRLAGMTAGPIAQAKAQQAIAELKIKQAQLLAPVIQKMAVGRMFRGKPLEAEEAGMAIKFSVPKEMQKEAFKEMGAIQASQQGVLGVKNDFDSIKALGLASQIPVTESSAEFTSARAGLLANVIKSMGSNPSDRDMKVIQQMLPTAVDMINPGRLDKKMASMMEFVRRQQKLKVPTPLLDSHGIKIKGLPELGFTRR